MTKLPPELAAIAETEMPCTCAPDCKRLGGVDPACRCGDRDRAIAAAVNIQTRARLAEQDAVHADLSALLEALGMGTHARPQSSHEVMLECIAKVRKQRERLERTWEQLDDEAAARIGGFVSLQEKVIPVALAGERERIARLARDLAQHITEDSSGEQADYRAAALRDLASLLETIRDTTPRRPGETP